MTTPVLAATDFSDAAEIALRSAARIASERGADLVLAHAFDSPGWAVVSAAATGTEVGVDVRTGLTCELERAAKALAATHGVPSKTLLLAGPASRELARLAERIGASVMVLGAHGELGRATCSSAARSPSSRPAPAARCSCLGSTRSDPIERSSR